MCFFLAVANSEQLVTAGLKAIADARKHHSHQSFLDRLQAEVVRFDHLAEAYSLPGLHREPFDRADRPGARGRTNAGYERQHYCAVRTGDSVVSIV